MKNRIKTTIMLVLTVSVAHGQTAAEWLRQKQTQKIYLVQQIAALRLYAQSAKKGYQLAGDGLGTVGGFTRGEFDLHRGYFRSLKKVNPKVRQYDKVSGTRELCRKILADDQAVSGLLGQSAYLSGEELQYIRQVYARLLKDCESTMEELVSVTADNELEMTDKARLARIDQLHSHMMDNYSFSKSFGNQARGLALGRKREGKDIKTSRALQGIK